uniref:Polyprotein n=1 Tax=Orthopteran flavi-related virus TaxID=2822566 RepID=A0A8A6RH10_9FLAV|nr:polyprotein [Orthopteran flavi-related virus]
MLEKFKRCWPFGGKSEFKQHSADQILNVLMKVKDTCFGFFTKMMASNSVLALVDLKGALGGGILALIYKNMERYLTKTVAFVIMSIAAGILHYFTNTATVVGAVVTAIVTYFLKEWVCDINTPEHIKRLTPNDNSPFLRMLTGTVLGAGISVGFKMLQGSGRASIIPASSIYTNLTPVQSVVNGGQLGLGCIAIKNLYHLIIKSNSVGEGFVLAASTLTTMYNMNWLGFLTTGISLAALLGLRGMYFHMRKEYAKEQKGQAALQEWNESADRFDQLAMWALSTTSVIANPASFLSILCGGLYGMQKQGKSAKTAFVDAFQRYAGVNFFLVLVEKAVDFVRSVDVQQNSASDILTCVASLISMLSSAVYITNTNKIAEFTANGADFIVKAYNSVSKFLVHAFNVIKDFIAKMIKTIGHWFGLGAKEAIIGRKDDKLGQRTQEDVLPMVFFNSEVATDMMNLYKRSGGLSLWESAFYFSLVPGSTNSWGDIHNLKLFKRVMGSTNNNAANIIEFVVPLNLKTFCVCTNQIANRVETLMGVGEYNDNVFKVVHHMGVDITIEYSTAFTSSRMHNIFVLTSYKQQVAVSLYGIARGDETLFYLMGFGINEKHMGQVLDIMAKFCFTLGNTQRKILNDVPEVLKNELGLKKLKAGYGTYLKNKAFDYAFKLNSKMGQKTFKKAWESLHVNRPACINEQWWKYHCFEISKNYYNSVPMASISDKLYYYNSDERIPRGLSEEYYKLPDECDDFDWINLNMQVNDKENSLIFYSSSGLEQRVNFGGSIDDIKMQLLLVSYNVGVGIFVKTKTGFSVSPYGLDCHCAFKYDMCTNELFYKACETHLQDQQYRIKIGPHVPKVGRIELSDDDLLPYYNAIVQLIADGSKKSHISTAVKKMKSFDITQITKDSVNWMKSVYGSPSEDVKENSNNFFSDIWGSFASQIWKDGRDERSLYEEVVDSASQAYISDTANFDTLHPADIEEEESNRRPVLETKCDYPSSLLGFGRAVIGRGDGWNWHKAEQVPYVNPDKTMKLYGELNKKGQNISKATWERIAHNERYILPKRISKTDDVVHLHASRAFFKAQLLHEADPTFFDDAVVILDPACGYGGFEQYFGNVYFEKPKYIFINSLNVAQHRIPDIGRMQVKGSNVHIVNLFDVMESDNNNVRYESCRERTRKQIEQAVGPRAVDMIIYDIGEFRNNSDKQRRFWEAEGYSCDSLIVGMEKLLENLREGGKMLMKFTGHFAGGHIILNRILKHFTRFKAHKVATQGYFSTEFYIYASGYHINPSNNVVKINNFYNWIGRHIYEGLNRAESYILRPYDFDVRTRNDWVFPRDSQMVYATIPYENYPPGYQYKFKGKYWDINEQWQPNWNPRLNQFFKYMHKNKKLRFIKVAKQKAEHLTMLGHFRVNEKSAKIKNTYNALISDMVYNVFGIDAATSTYGHTQSTREFREQSFKKRLDVNPGELNPMVMQELADVLPLMVSEYGQGLKRKCNLLGKEKVLSLMNKQGATGIFSKFVNLEDFIAKVPDWYEVCLEYCVKKWKIGEATHGHFSIMHKNEPKARKDAKDGRLQYDCGSITRSELIENSHLPHRYIQYADEITRIAHYIVLGDLIDRAGVNKVYKGTINGTPPFTQGNILRACWDLNTPKDQRVFDFGENKHGELYIEDVDGYFADSKRLAAGICLDFSGWDGTVTSAERYLEYKFISQFYPEALHSTIKHMLAEMSFGICLDHDGNVWLRSGQRGSGEITTSFGNTLLVGANIYRAVSKILAIPIETVLQTVAKIYYKVSNKIKILEVTRIPQFSDGDDTVIISNDRICKNLQDHLSEVVAEANKLLRSGQESGSKLVTDFKQLEFCSHTYEPIVIGPMANQLSCSEYKQIQLAKAGLFKLKYLPCKPTADILSRFRLTLKFSTQQWKDDDGVKDGCIDITRSKILSYMLLYPHFRTIRYSCLSLLSVIGDGPSTMTKFISRYRYEMTGVDFTTSMGALKSVFGVDTLNDIGLRQYIAENKQHRYIRYNALLGGHNVPSDITSLTRALCKWVLINKVKDFTPILFDHKFMKLFGFAYAHFYGTSNTLVKSLKKRGPVSQNFIHVWENYVKLSKQDRLN